MENRTLKVRSGFYDYVPKHSTTPVPVPFILLKGYWLQTYNFKIGNAVSVQAEINQLILSIKKLPHGVKDNATSKRQLKP